jgi:hypothetical protein
MSASTNAGFRTSPVADSVGSRRKRVVASVNVVPAWCVAVDGYVEPLDRASIAVGVGLAHFFASTWRSL